MFEMSDNNVVIRKCKKEDWRGIMEVCYRTGYMGEDATGRFSDKYLFGLLFCLYYPWYEPWNCYVAESKAENDKIVGYILGTMDSDLQEKHFAIKMVPRIIFRLITTSWWRYPNVLKILVHLISQAPKVMEEGTLGEDDLNKKYPAHLHIDILEDYQRIGIGSKLINKLETHLKKYRISGIHLGTSTRNIKAVPFYKKHGYKIIKIGNASLWPDASEEKDLTFVKKL